MVTDRLLSLLRRPATWVALCVAYAVLTAVGKLFAVFAPAWVMGGFRFDPPTAVQRLRDGLPLYVGECAKLFGVRSTDIWVLFGESVLLALCWLALAYFVLRHRPWARVAVLALLAVGALNYAVWAVLEPLHTRPQLETALFIGVLLFVFTRRGVVALFRSESEA
jgi:hypothetical protein